eukprot:290609-Prymnesium_polylepis.1
MYSATPTPKIPTGGAHLRSSSTTPGAHAQKSHEGSSSSRVADSSSPRRQCATISAVAPAHDA